MPLEHGTQGRGPVFYNLLCPATVSDRKVDTKGIHIRVTHPDKSGVVSSWLPVLQMDTVGARRQFLPRIGGQAWVLYDPTGVEEGLVLGTTYTTNLPPPAVSSGADVDLTVFDDGSAFQFNPDTSIFTITTLGEIDITTTGPIKIVSTGDVDVTTQGKAQVTATGDVNVTTQGNLNANVTGTATVTAPAIKLAGNVHITGTCLIDNNLTVNGSTTTVQNLTIVGTETGGGST